MRRTHSVGLVLWRGGLLLAAGWIVFETVRAIVRFIEIPAEMQLGVGLLLGGLVLVIVSLIAERVRDSKLERGLHE